MIDRRGSAAPAVVPHESGAGAALLRQAVMMTPNEKRDMPYIVGLACVAAALMIALAALWR
jgi:hypothetical protein